MVSFRGSPSSFHPVAHTMIDCPRYQAFSLRCTYLRCPNLTPPMPKGVTAGSPWEGSQPRVEPQLASPGLRNDTMANLTLMALGSSAPEILLSIIEIMRHGLV